MPWASWPSGILSRLDGGGKRLLLKESVVKYSWSLNMKKAWAVPRPASAILQKTAWASIYHMSRLEPPEETLPLLAVISVFDAHSYMLMILSNSGAWKAASQKAATVSLEKHLLVFFPPASSQKFILVSVKCWGFMQQKDWKVVATLLFLFRGGGAADCCIFLVYWTLPYLGIETGQIA